MNPGRIALLLESDGPGGAERCVCHLARELAGRGHRVLVVVKADGEGWVDQQLAASEIERAYFRIRRPLDFRLIRWLTELLKEKQIQWVHSHEFTMSFYGAIAARRIGVPHVMTMHGGRYYAERAQRRVAMRLATWLSGSIVGVSESVRQALAADLRLDPARIEVVPNGVHSIGAATPMLRRELGLGVGDRLLVAIGNLYLVKGHRYLLEAIARLNDKHPGLHLAIAGRGDQQIELEQMVTRFGLGGRVHLLGLRSDVAGLLASADLFIHPSLSEGLPLAVLEAMAAARPIIATSVGEIPAVLAGGQAGLLVPPQDAAALAGAIDALLTDPSRAAGLGSMAYRQFLDEYEITRMIDRYESLYAALLGEKRMDSR